MNAYITAKTRATAVASPAVASVGDTLLRSSLAYSSGGRFCVSGPPRPAACAPSRGVSAKAAACAPRDRRNAQTHRVGARHAFRHELRRRGDLEVRGDSAERVQHGRRDQVAARRSFAGVLRQRVRHVDAQVRRRARVAQQESKAQRDSGRELAQVRGGQRQVLGSQPVTWRTLSGAPPKRTSNASSAAMTKPAPMPVGETESANGTERPRALWHARVSVTARGGRVQRTLRTSTASRF